MTKIERGQNKSTKYISNLVLRGSLLTLASTFSEASVFYFMVRFQMSTIKYWNREGAASFENISDGSLSNEGKMFNNTMILESLLKKRYHMELII